MSCRPFGAAGAASATPWINNLLGGNLKYNPTRLEARRDFAWILR